MNSPKLENVYGLLLQENSNSNKAEFIKSERKVDHKDSAKTPYISHPKKSIFSGCDSEERQSCASNFKVLDMYRNSAVQSILSFH